MKTDQESPFFKDAIEYCAAETKPMESGSWKLGVNIDFQKLVFEKNHSFLEPVIKDQTHFLLCGLELPKPPRYPNLDVLGVACSKVFSGKNMDPIRVGAILSEGLKYECAVTLPNTDISTFISGRYLERVGESATDQKIPVFIVGLVFSDDCTVSLQTSEDGDPFIAIGGEAKAKGNPLEDLQASLATIKLDREPPPKWSDRQTSHLRMRERDRPGLQINHAMAVEKMEKPQ